MPEEMIIDRNPATITSAPDAGGDDDMFGGLDDAINLGIQEAENQTPAKKAQAEPVTQESPKEADKPKLDIKATKTEAAAEVGTTEAEITDIPEDAPVPRKSEDWKKFRQAYTHARALLQDREAKVAELQKQAESLKDVEVLRKERDELQARVKEISVLGDPAVTRDLDAKIEKVSTMAKTGLDAGKQAMFEAAIRMPPSEAKDRALASLFEDLPSHKQGVISAHLATIEQVQAEREARLEEAKANVDTIYQQREQAQLAAKQERSATLERAYQDATNELRSKEGWKDLFEDAGFSQQMAREAKEIYSGNVNDPKVLAQKAYMAAVAPALMTVAIDQANKVAELEAVVAKLRGATPSISSTTPAASRPDDDDDFLSLDKLQKLMY
jgi:hypothetical protein